MVVFGPGAKSLCLTLFGPVNDGIPHNPALSVPTMCFVDPDVEATSGLHVNSPGNKVGHHFLAETLHLCNYMVLRVVSVCKVILVLSNCLRMFILASLQLVDVVFEKLLSIFCDHLLPSHKCCTTRVTVNTTTGSVKEFFSQLKLPDEPEPREPHIFFSHVLSLISEPVAFFIDKLLTFDRFRLA